MEIQAAQIYGSSTYGKGFIEGVSDIDICVYTNKMGKMPDEKIVGIIKNSNKDFKDKEPVIIDDYIAHRIEFYYMPYRKPRVYSGLNAKVLEQHCLFDYSGLYV